LKAKALTFKNSNPLLLHLNHDQVKKQKKKKRKKKRKEKTDFFPTISVSTLFGFTHLFSDMFVNKALLYAVFASER
jgi:hypothetical protein